ncbi:hypothetical protein J6590_090784 [Homalodisca vitripennis]|nr:hypothetical protein J6590_090784 [Homalodisca vitripennis]
MVTTELIVDKRAMKCAVGEVRDNNQGTNGIKVTSEPRPVAGRRAACKDRIAQPSLIRKKTATIDVACSG